jgi:type II secretory pathway pseudopilin PulG
MKRGNKGFSIVDVLIIIAILLIVVGMVGPKLARKDSKAKHSPAPISATVRPAR